MAGWVMLKKNTYIPKIWLTFRIFPLLPLCTKDKDTIIRSYKKISVSIFSELTFFKNTAGNSAKFNITSIKKHDFKNKKLTDYWTNKDFSPIPYYCSIYIPPKKTSENLWISIFRRYKKIPVA